MFYRKSELLTTHNCFLKWVYLLLTEDNNYGLSKARIFIKRLNQRTFLNFYIKNKNRKNTISGLAMKSEKALFLSKAFNAESNKKE